MQIGCESGKDEVLMTDFWVVRIENLSEAHHRPTIRDEGKLYSATGDGRTQWVSAEDIAAVAYRALLDEKSHDCDHVLVGTGLLSYGQVTRPSHLPGCRSRLTSSLST